MSKSFLFLFFKKEILPCFSRRHVIPHKPRISTEGAGRSAGLDVVRALAILMVLTSHYGTYFATWYHVDFPVRLAVAGFFGVELFFVLSGFLIGRLLIDILDNGGGARAWLRFMVRRWLRTLPLYFVCLAAFAVIWPPHFWENGGHRLADDLPWFISLTQNLAWRMVDDWFGVSWSLTVEEWFYLLFSAVLLAAAAILGRRVALAAALLLFLCVPPALRWSLPAATDWNQVTSKVVIYRLDAIAFGVAVAWLHVRRSALLRDPRWALLAGLLIIGLFWAGTLDRLLHPSIRVRNTFIFDVGSLGFALWLPAAASLRWQPPRWLAGTARALSNQSYAMYLTHLTLIEIINFYRPRLHLPAWVAVLGTVGILYGITLASFHFLERPILARRPRQYRVAQT